MRKHISLVATALLLQSLGQTSSAAQMDWPQWRGPNRDGLSAETGLLQEWPKEGPALLWKAAGLGAGYSGVSLAGQRIFTMGERGDANYVLALNRADGKILWSTKLGKAGAPGWGGFAGPRATPTVDGSLVFALGQYGEVICVKAEDGKEVWRKHLTTDFGGPLVDWGFSESPLVDGDQVLPKLSDSCRRNVHLRIKEASVLALVVECWTGRRHCLIRPLFSAVDAAMRTRKAVLAHTPPVAFAERWVSR